MLTTLIIALLVGISAVLGLDLLFKKAEAKIDAEIAAQAELVKSKAVVAVEKDISSVVAEVKKDV